MHRTLVRRILGINNNNHCTFSSHQHAAVQKVQNLGRNRALITQLFRLMRRARTMVTRRRKVNVRYRRVFKVTRRRVQEFILTRIARGRTVQHFRALRQITRRPSRQVRVRNLITFTEDQYMRFTFREPSFYNRSARRAFMRLRGTVHISVLLRDSQFIRHLFHRARISHGATRCLVTRRVINVVFSRPDVNLNEKLQAFS